MAYRNPTGVETGDTLQFSTVTGTVAANSTRQRSGRYCLRANPTTTATGFVRYGDVDTDGAVVSFNAATGWFSIYFQYLTLPSADNEPIFNCRYAGGNKAEVRINSTGNILVYDNTLTLVGTGATALESGRYYRIGFYVTTSSSASAYQVTIDGASELSSTGTFTNNNIATFEIGKTANRNGRTVDFYYDDILFDDASDPGDRCILWAGVTRAGSTNTFAGGTYADVDETPPHDGTATKLDDATSGHVALFGLTCPAVRGPITGFKGIVIAQEAAATVSSVAVRIRTQGTNYDNSGRNLTTSFTASQKFYALNPFNSAAWTIDDINAVEVGLVQGASIAIECTLVGAEVCFTPSPIPGSSMNIEVWQ